MGQTFPPIVRFLRNLKEFRIERAILFGSRARGDWLKESDWDLLLVSPDFAGLSFQERIKRALDSWKGPMDLEVLCYTPEELSRKSRQIGIVQTALREGIEIFSSHRPNQKAA